MSFEKTVKIGLKQGLHARPAAELAKMAMQHEGEAIMLVGEKRVNLKSVINVMTAGVQGGQTARLQITGEGADRLMERISSLLEDRTIQ